MIVCENCGDPMDLDAERVDIIPTGGDTLEVFDAARDYSCKPCRRVGAVYFDRLGNEYGRTQFGEGDVKRSGGSG